MKIFRLIFFIILTVFISCIGSIDTNNLMIGERISGPANVRDTINGKRILFSLDDDIVVECTDEIDNWFIVGLFVKLNEKQYTSFKIASGDTLFDMDGIKIGMAESDIKIWMADEEQGIKTGLITGYTHFQNIKPESIIEKVISKTIENNYKVTVNDLEPIIKSFRLQTCSSNSMGDENGKWYYYSDNIIDDISPRDRITFIVENDLLIGIVHSRNIELKGKKTYDLIRGHKFTPISKLSESEIKDIVDERIKWYNTVD